MIILFLFLFCFFSFLEIAAEEDGGVEPDLTEDAKSAILIEPTTLEVIYEKNADIKRHPASMTKVMTMIIIMESLEKKIISLDETLYASEYAKSMTGTKIYLEAGEGMSVRDLLKSVAICSANDASVVFAEAIAGSVANFARMMNNKAAAIGCTNTTFKNPHGLPDANHMTTARDMALMSAYLVNNYPEILQYTSIYEDYVREETDKRFWLVNTNKLVRFAEGVDGIKTGWHSEAGYCLAATISKENKRFIAVLMGGTSPTVRNKEIMQMLNYALANYDVHSIYSKNDILGTYEDVSFSPSKYNIIITKDVNVLLKKGERPKEVTIEKNINYDDFSLDDKKVGTVKIFYDGALLAEIDLAVKEEIQRANFFEVFWEVIKEIFLVS